MSAYQSSSDCERRKKESQERMKLFIILSLLVIQLAIEISSHGMVMNPVGRGSRWRVDSSAPKNYDDNGSNCGGFSNQWTTHSGKCGICGDPYQDATPRKHELGGKYGGSGVIVASYAKASTIEVVAKITANHLGKFTFDLCNLDVESESEACFAKNKLKFADEKDEFKIGRLTGDYRLNLKLPQGLTCNHCVLRWQYTAGNNWGFCNSTYGALGCGAQENFRTCSDIKIVV
jgi:hypothetical protein